jgi:hypothetical protein
MKIVIEVFTAAAMLGEAGSARAALAVMADATEVATTIVGSEYIGAEVNRLGVALEAAARARQLSQVHSAVDGDEHIGVFRYRLGRRQRTHKCDTQHSGTIAGGLHEGSDGKKKRPARLGN